MHIWYVELLKADAQGQSSGQTEAEKKVIVIRSSWMDFAVGDGALLEVLYDEPRQGQHPRERSSQVTSCDLPRAPSSSLPSTSSSQECVGALHPRVEVTVTGRGQDGVSIVCLGRSRDAPRDARDRVEGRAANDESG